MVSAGASRADADADVEASAALASDRRDHRAAAADARRRITEEGAALGTRCAQKKSFLQRSRRRPRRVPILFVRFPRRERQLYVCVSVWNLDFGAARRRPCFERLVAPFHPARLVAATSEDGEA